MYAGWYATMGQQAGTPDGAALRAHLELAARQGSVNAQRELEGPEYPVELDYLWQMFTTLNGMRNVGLSGAAPLTPEGIDAANRLFQWQLEPREVEAIRQLDIVTRHPEALEKLARAEADARSSD